ncbi:MAG TPA: metal-dependent hydrolase [Candidatus Hypogeohydataceae bacterium YC38]|nr:metal-dependent hydrolase [Candidatus Brocadiales bacterium]
MILGHLTCTYLAYRALEKKGIRLILPVLLVGAYLPDVIDKPLCMLLALPAHGMGHSFLVLLLLFTPLILFLKNYRGIVATMGLGCLLHLLEDLAQSSSILWPLVGNTDPEEKRFTFSNALYVYYIQHKYPATLFVEVLSILGCILLITYERVKSRFIKFKEGEAVKKCIEVEKETL